MRSRVWKKLTFFAIFLLLSWGGRAHRLWAKQNPISSEDSSSSEKGWGKSEATDDTEIDLGGEDDNSDQDFDQSRFQQDGDDTYDDLSGEGDGQAKSKFKEDQDEDPTDQDDG